MRISDWSSDVCSSDLNPDAKRYILYLIDRYHQFARADRTRTGAYNYARIHQSIKTKFRAKWDHLPIAMFPDLYRFLQQRIDGTILGKVRKARGQASYSDLDEYTAGRSEARRVGKECVSTCRSRWARYI